MRGRTRSLKLAAVAFLVVVPLTMVAVAAICAYGVIQPVPSAVSSRGLETAYESVDFISRDGLSLSGWYIPSQDRAAIILTHGYDSNRAQLIYHANFLAQRGYGVLLYDLRGQGESEGRQRTFGWLEVNDLLGALDYLQTRNDVEITRIGAYGFSVGGQVTIRAAALTNGIKAVAADGVATAIFSDNPAPANLPDWGYMPISWLNHTFSRFC